MCVCVYGLLYEFCFLWFTNCVLLSDDNSLIPGCLSILASVSNNTLILGIWCSTIPHLPGCFCHWTFFQNIGFKHGAIGPLYVTSSYSTWIFFRGVSGFATDCPCDVWCRGLTTCLLHVGPPFGNRFLNTSWAVGLTNWIVYLHLFCILTYVLIHHIIFWLYLYLLNILYFFKYSCTNIFHRRSVCTFYSDAYVLFISAPMMYYLLAIYVCEIYLCKQRMCNKMLYKNERTNTSIFPLTWVGNNNFNPYPF